MVLNDLVQMAHGSSMSQIEAERWDSRLNGSGRLLFEQLRLTGEIFSRYFRLEDFSRNLFIINLSIYYYTLSSAKMSSTDAQKKVLEEVQGSHALKKTETHESLGVAQAKTLNAITKGTGNLSNHVDAPESGLTDAQKQAYLDAKKNPEEQ